MLFYASEKYPDEDSYSKYISEDEDVSFSYWEQDRINEQISIAIADDDKEHLLSLLNTPGGLYEISDYYKEHRIWEEICRQNAVNCATAFLEGKWKLGSPMGINSPFGCFGEVAFPLHYAAKSLSAELVQLFLSHGARTDIKLHDPRGMRGHHGLLPLEIALDVAREQYGPEQIVFSPKPSIIQLIASLCNPGMYYPLKAIKLLARSSENVGNIAYKYAMEGKLAEFAVLLMVAPEKVLVPITFSTQDRDGWDGSMTLHQCLENRRGWLRSIALLLQVFERAGNAIEECILVPRSKEEMEIDLALRLKEAGFRLEKGDIDFSIDDRMNSRVPLRGPIECLGTGVPFMPLHSPLLLDPSRKEEVEIDLALRLKEAGFRLKRKDGDFDFSIDNRMNSCVSVRSPIECLGTGVHFMRPHSPLLPDPSRKGINRGNVYGFSRPYYPSKRTHSYVPKSIFVSHYSTTSDVQVKNQTKTMEQGLPKYLTREKLAYISMLIKKRIRSA